MHTNILSMTIRILFWLCIYIYFTHNGVFMSSFWLRPCYLMKQVVSSLLILSILGAFSLQSLFVIGLLSSLNVDACFCIVWYTLHVLFLYILKPLQFLVIENIWQCPYESLINVVGLIIFFLSLQGFPLPLLLSLSMRRRKKK